MDDGETGVQLADAPAPKLGGAHAHKPDCQCPFCKRRRGETVLNAGRKKASSLQTRPAGARTSPPVSDYTGADDKAVSSAETLQALHDLGNAIWEDDRWEIPDAEALEWGETTVPLRERFELVDVVLGGGIFGRPAAKLLKIERNRAIKIIPEQGLTRRRGKRKAETSANVPPVISHDEWVSMDPQEQQAYQDQYAASYGVDSVPIGDETLNGNR